MEEARSLEPRRVKIEFLPQRMADHILSLAFERLLSNGEAIDGGDHSVQNEPDTDLVEVAFGQEVMQ